MGVYRSIGRGKALPMTMLGEPMTASEAERLGMIWRVIDDEKLIDEALKTATKLGSNSAAAMVASRNLLDNAPTSTFEEQIEHERRNQEILFDRPDAPYKENNRRFREAAAKRQARL